MLKEIQMRRSIRKYLSKPVEEEKLTEILESARLAPSGSNTQPWHYIVVKDEAVKQKLAQVAHNQRWMLSAPVFIVCVADIRSRIKGNPELVIDELSPEEEVKQIIRDTAISIEHILLEANNSGLATCWVAWYIQKDIRPVLNIPTDKYVVGIVTLGYAAETPPERPRKMLSELVHYEKW